MVRRTMGIKDEWHILRMRKTLQFSFDEDLPIGLIKQLVKTQFQINEENEKK